MKEDALLMYLKERVEKIDEKVDQLLAFKWQVIGASMVVSVVVTLGIQLLMKFA